MTNGTFEIIVIGGGHAGLSASYFLKQSGLSHLVLERGKTSESWRSQRWDSFVLNTPNWMNVLPGEAGVEDPGGFISAGEYVSSLEAFASKHGLPVAEQHEVLSLNKRAGVPYFTVTVAAAHGIKTYSCSRVIVCAGCQSGRKIPAFSNNIGPGILQLHASEYRNAAQLPPGAVMVVGSGQSGCQVADELAASGKQVYLSSSLVGRLPRRYRGRDIMEWLTMARFFDVRRESIADPGMLNITPPQLTGTNGGRCTISLQSLARKGVTILGRMEAADQGAMFFQPDAAAHVEFADGFSQNIKHMIDRVIIEHQINAPARDADPADLPDPTASCVSAVTSLDLYKHNIKSVIWSTGFTGSFEFIKLPVLDASGLPIHHHGKSPVDGLYFLGLHWLRTRKSGLLGGITDDAETLVEQLAGCSPVLR